MSLVFFWNRGSSKCDFYTMFVEQNYKRQEKRKEEKKKKREKRKEKEKKGREERRKEGKLNLISHTYYLSKK